MITLDTRLSTNFTFGEMIRSETAERCDDLMLQQVTPPEEILEAMKRLCQSTLQPIRDMLQPPPGPVPGKQCLSVTSGYRCLALNRILGSSDSSAHPKGEAADTSLPPGKGIEEIIRRVNLRVMERTGFPVRPDVNRNFYLFALICLNLEKLDIDQVIHEYGPAYGQPAWIHVSSSERQNKREILVIGRYVNNGARTRMLCVDEALKLGI